MKYKRKFWLMPCYPLTNNCDAVSSTPQVDAFITLHVFHSYGRHRSLRISQSEKPMCVRSGSRHGRHSILEVVYSISHHYTVFVLRDCESGMLSHTLINILTMSWVRYVHFLIKFMDMYIFNQVYLLQGTDSYVWYNMKYNVDRMTF